MYTMKYYIIITIDCGCTQFWISRVNAEQKKPDKKKYFLDDSNYIKLKVYIVFNGACLGGKSIKETEK